MPVVRLFGGRAYGVLAAGLGDALNTCQGTATRNFRNSKLPLQVVTFNCG